jgi:hypothetical protein
MTPPSFPGGAVVRLGNACGLWIEFAACPDGDIPPCRAAGAS